MSVSYLVDIFLPALDCMGSLPLSLALGGVGVAHCCCHEEVLSTTHVLVVCVSVCISTEPHTLLCVLTRSLYGFKAVCGTTLICLASLLPPHWQLTQEGPMFGDYLM